MKNDRIERLLRRFTAELPRRKVIAVLLCASPLLPLVAPGDADAGREKRRNGEPGPQPPKCVKLGAKCFASGDCCGSGTRCKKAGRKKCRCKTNRAKCGPVCCPAGEACCDQCADLQTDENNCGACFNVCGENETCVAGVCTS